MHCAICRVQNILFTIVWAFENIIRMNCVVLATLLAHLVSASPEQDTSSVNSGSARQLGGPQSLWEVILLPQSYFDRRYYYSNHLQHSTDSYKLPYTTTSPYLGGGISYPTLFIGSPASSLTKRQHPFTNYATFPRLTDATTARTSLATTLRPPSEAAKDLSEQSTSNLRTRKGPPSKSSKLSTVVHSTVVEFSFQNH